MPEARFDSPGSMAAFDLHHWADWIELLCIENPDGSIGRKDVEKRLRQSRGLEKQDDNDELLNDLGVVDDDDKQPLIDDKITERVQSWFEILSSRQSLFGADYPFAVHSDKTRMDIVDPLSFMQKIYLCLLFMSNLRFFSDKEAQLTSEFEFMSLICLRHFLPFGAQFHVFGKGRAATSRYSGKIYNRLEKLCHDLGGSFEAKEDDYPPTSTGDAGLDLIAWVPFVDDPASGRFAIFGQCACTTEWTTKQHSSAPINFCNGKMTLQCPPVNVICTPFCHRKEDGTWHRPQDFGSYLHLDRLRVTKILSARPYRVDHLDSIQTVESVVSIKAEAY